jgi:hypothetical protein
MLHHAARRTAGAAGVDDAGQLLALERGTAATASASAGCLAIRSLPVVEVHRPRLAGADLVDPDHHPRRGRADRRGQQCLGELGVRDDDRAGARILDDVLVIALGVGGVGRHRHAARGHDRQIGDAEFRPVLGDQHHPVAVLQPQRLEAQWRGWRPGARPRPSWSAAICRRPCATGTACRPSPVRAKNICTRLSNRSSFASLSPRAPLRRRPAYSDGRFGTAPKRVISVTRPS